MGIDVSVLTHIVFIICAVIACICSYKKYKNMVRVLFVFLWAASVYYVTACCLLPIPLAPSGDPMLSFGRQFSFMTYEQFQEYFFEMFVQKIPFFSSFLCFAFCACLLFNPLRKLRFGALLLIGLMAIHLVYNVTLNVLVDEIVKPISSEDFLIMSMGYIVGWLCAKISLTVSPRLGSCILADKSGE